MFHTAGIFQHVAGAAVFMCSNKNGHHCKSIALLMKRPNLPHLPSKKYAMTFAWAKAARS
jgi:hypothetical protein